MKTYTDIEQSHNLAEILPNESADMCWTNHCYGRMRSSLTISAKSIYEYKKLLERFADSTSIDVFYPAWSLTALLEQIPSDLGSATLTIEKDDSEPLKYGLNYHDRCGKEDDIQTKYYNNLVDACYEMILKLNEQKFI